MRRGTTPTHTFHTDLDLSQAEAIYVTYAQEVGGGEIEVVAEYTLDNGVEVDGDTITVTLTEEDTLKMMTARDRHLVTAKDMFESLHKGIVMAQIRVKFSEDNKIASDVVKIQLDDILKDGAI